MILWIPVRSSSYEETALKNYQAIPDPIKPLAEISNPNETKLGCKSAKRFKKLQTARTKSENLHHSSQSNRV